MSIMVVRSAWIQDESKDGDVNDLSTIKMISLLEEVLSHNPSTLYLLAFSNVFFYLVLAFIYACMCMFSFTKFMGVIAIDVL